MTGKEIRKIREDLGLSTEKFGRAARRGFVKSRLLLRRVGRTRTAGAAAELGKALRADIADLAEHLSRRIADNRARLDWKQEASRAATRFRSIAKRTHLPYAIGLGLLLVLASLAGALVWTLRDLPFAEVLKGG